MVSHLNATMKSIVDAATQAIVVRKLDPFLC